MKDSDAEKIAPAVARCHAPRKTGRVTNKAMLMRFKKMDFKKHKPRDSNKEWAIFPYL